MFEVIIAVVVWTVFRSLAAKSTREKAQRKKAEREGRAEGFFPEPVKPVKPVKPSRPRGFGEWAKMLGEMTDGSGPVFQKQMAAPTPWRNEAAFPAAASFPQKEQVREEQVAEVFASPEGVDECHETMLAGPVPEMPEPDAVPVRFDAPALVKGVIFAEILTRPVQRRRPGMPRL